MPCDLDRLPAVAPPAPAENEVAPPAPARPNHLAGSFPSAPPPGDPDAVLAARPEVGLFYPGIVESPAEGMREMLFGCFIGRYDAFHEALLLVDAAANAELGAAPDPGRAEKLRGLRRGLAEGRVALREQPTEEELDLILGSLSSGDLAGNADWLRQVYGGAAPRLLGRLQEHTAQRYAGDAAQSERVAALLSLMGVGGLGAVVLRGGPEVDGRTPEEVGAELRARVSAYRDAIPGARQSAGSGQERELEWLAELGAVGRFVGLFQDRERPDPGRWSLVMARWDEAGARMSQVLLMEAGATTLGPFGEAAAESITLFEDAARMDHDARAEFMAYLRGFSDVAETSTTVLTVVRDLSFATAVSLAVVLAAPVVMGAASAAATGTLGLSGAGATAAAGGATAATMGAFGASLEGGLRAFAASVDEGIELLGTLSEGQVAFLDAVDAYDWGQVVDEGWEGFKAGFLDGVLALAGPALEAKVLHKVMRAAPLEGVTILGLGMQRARESAIAAGVSGGVIGALDAGVREAMAGGDLGAVCAAAEAGFVIGAAVGAAFGGAGGALQGAQAARRNHLDEEIRGMLRLLDTDPDRFARRYNELVEEMSPQQRAAFERELQGRRFIDKEHYDAAAEAFEDGTSDTPPEHRYGAEFFDAWSEGAEVLSGRDGDYRLLTPELLQETHRRAAGPLNKRPGEMRYAPPDVERRPFTTGGDIGPLKRHRVIDPRQLAALRTNPYLKVFGKGELNAHLTPEQKMECLTTAIVDYPPHADVGELMEGYFRWYRQHQFSSNPVAFAAEAQWRLVSIHPFYDGNGRTSRLVMDHALGESRLPPALLNNPSNDLWSSPEAWEREVREGVMNTYRLALKHLGAFNVGCELGDLALAAGQWGALLALADSPDRLVEWAYKRSE